MKSKNKCIIAYSVLLLIALSVFSINGVSMFFLPPWEDPPRRPPKPSILSATFIGNGRITIEWADNPLTDEYRIYRCSSEFGEYEYPTWRGSLTLTYTDQNFPSTGEWWYKIKAINEWGGVFSSPKSCYGVVPLEYYNPACDISNQATWDTDYTSWVNRYSQNASGKGKYIGNLFTANFFPKEYTHTPGGDYYDLVYVLNVHTQTNMGDINDGSPQPTIVYDDNKKMSFPMVVHNVKVSTEFVGTQSFHSKLWFYDITRNTFLGDYSYSCEEGAMHNQVWNGEFSGDLGCWISFASFIL